MQPLHDRNAQATNGQRIDFLIFEFLIYRASRSPGTSWQGPRIPVVTQGLLREHESLP